MKVLLINNFHYPKGGSESVYFNTGKLLEWTGNQVCYFSVARDENIPCQQAEYFITDTSRKSKVRGLFSYFYNAEAARKLERLIIAERPDIAHAHLMWGCTAPAIFKVLRKYHIPLVHTAHDYRMVCPAYTFFNKGKICEDCKGRKFYMCAVNRCSKGSFVMSTMMATEIYYRNIFFNPAVCIDGLIYVSSFAKEIHEKYAPQLKRIPSIVLYNCTRKANVGEKKRGGYFLYFGRLSHEKGVEVIVDVFGKLPALKLKVAGTGPMEMELRKMADGCQNIEFLGFKQGEELDELRRNAQFVIVPSQWYENNPMTIVESYSFGTPVIGSKLGGIPEIIEEGKTGFLFESDRVDNLANVLMRVNNLSQDEYQAMSDNAYCFYEQHFSAESHYKKLTGFYDSIMKNQH